MQQNESSTYLSRKKDKDANFPFQVLLTEHKTTNDVTGEAAFPLIGKYSRNQYHFLDICAVVGLQLTYADGHYIAENRQINVPQEVDYLLQTIPELIPHNFKPKSQPGSTKNTKKKQGKKQGKMQEQPQQQQQTITQMIAPQAEFHPLRFRYLGLSKFFWTVNVLRTNQIIEQLHKDPCLSYVNHNMVFEDIDFSLQKRLVQYLPVGIVLPNNFYEWNEDLSKSVSFGSIRSEYMSTHLAGGSLCFSPNNMKIGVFKVGQKLSSFWSVILRENNEHLIFYHWVIMDLEASHLARQMAQQASTIEELVKYLANLGEPEYIAEISEVLGIKL